MSLRSPWEPLLSPSPSQDGRHPPAGRLGLQGIVHHLLPDAESVYNHLNQAGRIKSFRPIGPKCHQVAGQMDLQGVTLLSYCGTETQFVVEPEALISVVAVFSGAFAVQDPLGVVEAGPNGGLLLPSGTGERHYSCTEAAAGAALFLQPAAIQRAAAAIAGLEGGAQPASPGDPAPLLALSPLQVQTLHGCLRYIDACALVDPRLPIRLGLDDLILRLVACWLQPELLDTPARQPAACTRLHAQKPVGL